MLAADADPAATGAFGPAGSLAARVFHTATALLDGRVLIVGGVGADSRSMASAEIWDPATGVFSPAGSMAEARYHLTSTPLPDGRVLVIGGKDRGGSVHPSAEIWHPETGMFSPAGSMAEARQGFTATPLPDGRVLVVGGVGYDAAGSPVLLASAQIWDPATGSFGPAGVLGEARWLHAADLLPDGRVLVVAGVGSTALDYPELLASAEIWDPATGSFGPAGSLDGARYSPTATALPDGRVLVAGGLDALHQALASAEVWDPTTGVFGPTGSLMQGRYGDSATLVLDGRVLVVGGWDADVDPYLFASAEVWDPETGIFSPAGAMAEARQFHASTLLLDGRVLVAGGWDLRLEPIASAEVWEPTTKP